MKYRVHNDHNYSERLGYHLSTYFRTKKEAVAYAQQIGGNAVIERCIGGRWFPC